MINYLFIIFLFFIVTLKAITIQNENDFIEKLTKSISDTTINLTIDTNIVVSKNFTLSTKIKKVSLNGKLSTSILTLDYPLYFDNHVEEVELKNITINGSLLFHNNKKITLDTIILNGNINTDMNDSINEYIKFNKLSYQPIENKKNHHCINIQGNLEITNSEFYGSSSCQERVLNYDGMGNYEITIKNSSISGEYQCSCLTISSSKKADIQYTYFEKGFSGDGKEGGSAIRMISTYKNLS
ncbi:hypothetical protein PIROE2DRAFT_21099 [Piromyces sp. E2]|nr:hypothetical protein PIROE2DRAFT_21099 [Piromyces sp. E2]|eukprot:OUM60346.1 hypothetical protein PIROE2DRAFT_21099 [Piromyces sp. E2]